MPHLYVSYEEFEVHKDSIVLGYRISVDVFHLIEGILSSKLKDVE